MITVYGREGESVYRKTVLGNQHDVDTALAQLVVHLDSNEEAYDTDQKESCRWIETELEGHEAYIVADGRDSLAVKLSYEPKQVDKTGQRAALDRIWRDRFQTVLDRAETSDYSNRTFETATMSNIERGKA